MDAAQLQVTFDAANTSFSIVAPAHEKPFAVGRFNVGGGSRREILTRDPAFGEGKGFEVKSADGSTARVSVYPNLPFVLCQVTMASPGAAPLVLNRVPLATFELQLDRPAAELKAMGSGGLAGLEKHPGSYVWLAVADPASRAGVVGGWITHDRASGVLFPKLEGAKLTLEARGDYGRLRLPPGAAAESETFAIGRFDDARLGLEAYADAVAKHYAIKLRPQPAGYCTWYSEKNGGAGTAASIDELSAFAVKNLVPWGFNFVQIDDHWQLGTQQSATAKTPKKNFTAANPAGPYPAGMKPTADLLKSRGLTPGIWFMPFSGTAADPWFADKQDLFLKDDKGQPYDVRWGGTSLDMTKPAAQQYVRSYVSRLAKEWGYTYFKMDGLYAGIGARQNYVNAGYKEDGFGDAVFDDPDKTNVEAYRDGMRLVRDAAGPDVFFLGCTMAQNMRMFGASFGLFDAMRVGPDNGGTWAQWIRSPQAASWNYFLNGRVWYNDPDPLYVRAAADATVLEQPDSPTTQQATNVQLKPTTQPKKPPTPITDDESRTIVTWHAVSGSLLTNGDWIPGLPERRLDLLRRAMPAHAKTARPADYFENDPPRLWSVTDGSAGTRRDVIAAFNWTAKPLDLDVPLARFGLPPAAGYVAFDFWGDRFVTLGDRLQLTLPTHGCVDLSVRPAAAHPVLVGTSRHITQGMVDVTEERWDDATHTLAGTSAVVAGDAYELRIAADGRPTKCEVDDASRAAGATIELMPATDGVRVRVTSPTSRAVKWRIAF